MSGAATLHRDAASRWGTFTLMEQMAHVGSEVERSIGAHDAHNEDRFWNALTRALELFDLTADDERFHEWREHGVRLEPAASRAGRE
jgi:hypothetical protein